MLIRDNIVDMEFIPFDENGRIIQNATNQYPAPEIEGIRDRMFDIRGVDMRITFRSKNPFFTRERQAPREVIGFMPNRSSLNEDQRYCYLHLLQKLARLFCAKQLARLYNQIAPTGSQLQPESHHAQRG